MVRDLNDEEPKGRNFLSKNEHNISLKRFFDIDSKYVGFETEDDQYKIFRVKDKSYLCSLSKDYI
jgi:hypothetical protein